MQIARAIENIICFCILHKKSRKQGSSTAALSASSHTKPQPVLDETESRDSFEANPSETQHGGLFLCCKDLARSMAAVMASMKQPLFSVTRRGQHLGYCSFLQQCPCASLSYSLTGSEEHPSLCRRFEVLKMQDRPPLAQRLCRHRSTLGTGVSKHQNNLVSHHLPLFQQFLAAAAAQHSRSTCTCRQELGPAIVWFLQ